MNTKPWTYGDCELVLPATQDKSLIATEKAPAAPLKTYIELACQLAIIAGLVLLAVLPLSAKVAQAAGTLTPVGSPQAPIQIKDHHLDVTINNGFAKTEVTQTFFNPNSVDLEGVYSFPVPETGALSEYTLYLGESELHGEVVERSKAESIYEEERNSGNDAGIASKNSYKNFEFKVAKIPAQQEIRIRFVYYSPVEVDTGIGRYVYPLEEGGTDEQALSFWTTNPKVENSFSGEINLHLAFPVDEVRLPGLEAITKIEKVSDTHHRVTFATQSAALSKDIVVYYRLSQSLPGRLEVIPYRKDAASEGTFMMTLTPGDDLKPITSGADYTFVLDTSGSMTGKIHTQARGVAQALGKLNAQDRFRIISFSDRAKEETRGWIAVSPHNVAQAVQSVERLVAGGSTNLYEALDLGLNSLDSDRVNSVILVTDGVTNTGLVDPKEFEALLQKTDVRIFGFLMGNSANWPLLRMIAETSGGFYSGVSNSDDIVGQLLLAKSKIASQALHDVELSLSGVPTSNLTGNLVRKLYRGEQLVIFGRYQKAGQLNVKLRARISGQWKEYTTSLQLPEQDTLHPELERLWAMRTVEDIEMQRDLGKLDNNEAKSTVASLGVEYQLVTDETSMLVLSDERFAHHQIDRKNQARAANEATAQAARVSQPVYNPRADSQQPMFGNQPAPHISRGGGGAIDPLSAGLLALLALNGGVRLRRKSQPSSVSPEA